MLYWVCIYLGIQRKGSLMYLKRSMGEQRKYSLISAKINREPGVQMTRLKIISPTIGLHQKNLSLRGKESCHHQLLVLCDRGHRCVEDSHIMDYHI